MLPTKTDQIRCETMFDVYVIRHIPMPGTKGFLPLNRLLFDTMYSDDFQTLNTIESCRIRQFPLVVTHHFEQKRFYQNLVNPMIRDQRKTL
jgi:hypothetical protein